MATAMVAQESLGQLAAGGTMHVGQSLTSPNGGARLAFQEDGNLVVPLLHAAILVTCRASCKDACRLLACSCCGGLSL